MHKLSLLALDLTRGCSGILRRHTELLEELAGREVRVDLLDAHAAEDQRLHCLWGLRSAPAPEADRSSVENLLHEAVL
ncbi:MAG: hypothetical protein GY772_18220, partial [bacterium]|nr:hypothetical protein [bacterium]